jgi:hypothetical protein
MLAEVPHNNIPRPYSCGVPRYSAERDGVTVNGGSDIRKTSHRHTPIALVATNRVEIICGPKSQFINGIGYGCRWPTEREPGSNYDHSSDHILPLAIATLARLMAGSPPIRRRGTRCSVAERSIFRRGLAGAVIRVSVFAEPQRGQAIAPIPTTRQSLPRFANQCREIDSKHGWFGYAPCLHVVPISQRRTRTQGTRRTCRHRTTRACRACRARSFPWRASVPIRVRSGVTVKRESSRAGGPDHGFHHSSSRCWEKCATRIILPSASNRIAARASLVVPIGMPWTYCQFKSLLPPA